MRESSVKDRILDTASRLFYDQGYHVTGINQIIDEADIARASLYNHFPSKTDLLLAYLGQDASRMVCGVGCLFGAIWSGQGEAYCALRFPDRAAEAVAV